MGFAVLHSEKGNISSGGIGNHIDRNPEASHTYIHADPNKMHLNFSYDLTNGFESMKLSDAIEKRIEMGYNGKRKIRTDAVKYNTHILTGSHEKMIEIFADKEKKEKWIKANYNFIKSEFGEENIVRFVLHLDEKTPHIHAVTVPLTEDGRLSSKEVLGNPKTLRDRQDKYAFMMQDFGLKRGISGTGIKHETAKEYYARIEDKGPISDDLSDYNKKSMLSIGLDKEKIKDTLKTANSKLKDKSQKLEQIQKKLEGVNQTIEKQHLELEKKELIIRNMLEPKYREHYVRREFSKFKDDIIYNIRKKPIFNKHEKIPMEKESVKEMVDNGIREVSMRRKISARYLKVLFREQKENVKAEVFNSAINKINDWNNHIDKLNSRDQGRGFTR